MGAVIEVPLYRYPYHYTWLDWSMFGLLYVVSGLGITVGYHRLMSHQSFNCPNWVKGVLLIGGAWALQNSAIKWAADHLRHHAHCDEEKDPYNAQQGFWHSHCGWLFFPDQYADPKYATRVAKDPVAIWQHKHYPLLLLAGLAGTFLIGFLFNGVMGGVGCFLLVGVGTHIRRAQFDVFHQLRLPSVGATAARHLGLQSGQLAGVPRDIWRGLP
jgi:stearoyl-CoA desaturase (delta-9 desaturase)